MTLKLLSTALTAGTEKEMGLSSKSAEASVDIRYAGMQILKMVQNWRTIAFKQLNVCCTFQQRSAVTAVQNDGADSELKLCRQGVGVGPAGCSSVSVDKTKPTSFA